MTQSTIPDSDIEKALDYLRDSAPVIGAARERLIRAEHMVKHIKAIEMKRWALQPVNAQEREAVASIPYNNAILEEAVAAGDYERLKALREAEALKIEVWRTMNANYRAMKI